MLQVRGHSTCEPGTVAAGALHADPVHASLRGRSGKQRSVAGRGGGDRAGAEQPAGLVKRGGDVGVGVSVDAEGDERRGVWRGR
jgi:hypothetical protein